ncbi:MAG: YciI family protein [Anaerolineales bacterium]|jgi:uncharacterized protein YciI
MRSRAEITDETIRKKVASGRQYTAFLYKTGPHRDLPPAEADRLQMEHLRHLFWLRAEGKLLLNGPVTDEGSLRGIGIFAATDEDEVRQLLEEDPAVKAGRLIYEIHPWFGIPGDGLPR